MTQPRTKKLSDLLSVELAKIGEPKTFMEIPSKAPMMGDSKPMFKLSDITQKPPEYMQHVKEFTQNPTGFFLISGTNGNGKTFTAQAIFDNYFDPMQDKKFWNQAELEIKFQALYAQYGCVDDFLNVISSAPLLVLDDVGTTRPTDAFMKFLYIIADRRTKLKDTLGTIITTNLNSKKMREVFGDAFVSRVASGRCVRHEGEDRRPVLF